MQITLVIIAVFVAIVVYRNFAKKNSIIKNAQKPFPISCRKILYEYVSFYGTLIPEDKIHFEKDIMRFLAFTKISGVDVNVDIRDRLLIASSAVIPVFSFPNWKNYPLDEVLLYKGNFNEQFATSNDGSNNIMGMVGTGYMNGKMALSKPALIMGFRNETDKKNTAIHEFVHLIDMVDGQSDGLPEILLQRQYALPWLDLIREKMNEILDGDSDINPYGATNKAEFFAVISEYFFERPELLKIKHPELYRLLSEMFQQTPDQKKEENKMRNIGRNDPCFCGSDKKYKHCCGSL